VIVCDSDSTDGTKDAILALAAHHKNLRYVNVAQNTLAAKRNQGIHAAKANIIIFMDDDAIPDARFVDSHVKAHEKSAGIVFCGQIRYPEKWITQSNYFRYRDSRHLGPSRPDVPPSDLPPWMITVMNLSFKRSEIVSQVGYVSEEFTRYGGEDTELGFRIVAVGMRLVYLPEALVLHYEYEGSIRKYYRKAYVAMRDSAPVLYRLAPGFLHATKGGYLERIYANTNVCTAILRQVARICTHPWAVRLTIGCLERIDRYRFLYLPSAYQYLTAVAALAGIRDRACTLQSLQLKGAWFE
jgi:GT2 family glycosyltransferase